MNVRNSFTKLAADLRLAAALYNPIQVKKTLEQKTVPVEGVASTNRNDLLPNLLSNHSKESFLVSKKFENNFEIQLGLCNYHYKVKKFGSVLPVLELPVTKNIIEPGEAIKVNIGMPSGNILEKEIELPCNVNKEMIDPVENIISKHAVYMIRLRRKKMRKHKLKKRRRKMRFEIAKKKQRKMIKKELILQTSLKETMKEGKDFSAEDYVTEVLRKVHWERPVTKVKGRLAPQWVIKEYLEKKRDTELLKERTKACIESSEYQVSKVN